MDEREAVGAVRNSLRAGKSRAEILGGFQKRGYTLAYGEQIIAKAKRPRKIFLTFVLAGLVFSTFAVVLYTQLSGGQGEHVGPLSLQKITGNVVGEPIQEQEELQAVQSLTKKAQTEPELEVTSQLISELLKAVGADRLRKNYLNFQDPIINVRMGDEAFHSVVRNGITTNPGLHEKADIIFDVPRALVDELATAERQGHVLRDSIARGQTKVEVLTTKANLLAKGYLKLHETLK